MRFLTLAKLKNAKISCVEGCATKLWKHLKVIDPPPLHLDAKWYVPKIYWVHGQLGQSFTYRDLVGKNFDNLVLEETILELIKLALNRILSGQCYHWQSHCAIIQLDFSPRRIQITQVACFLAIKAGRNNLQVSNSKTYIFQIKIYIASTSNRLVMACCLAIGTAGTNII